MEQKINNLGEDVILFGCGEFEIPMGNRNEDVQQETTGWTQCLTPVIPAV